MSPDLAQRQAAIAAVALLAIVVGLALGSQRGDELLAPEPARVDPGA